MKTRTEPGRRRRETREIWSDMRARGGDGEGEQKGNKECTMRQRY